jgi:hypothetical protein
MLLDALTPLMGSDAGTQVHVEYEARSLTCHFRVSGVFAVRRPVPGTRRSEQTAVAALSFEGALVRLPNGVPHDFALRVADEHRPGALLLDRTARRARHGELDELLRLDPNLSPTVLYDSLLFLAPSLLATGVTAMESGKLDDQECLILHNRGGVFQEFTWWIAPAPHRLLQCQSIAGGQDDGGNETWPVGKSIIRFRDWQPLQKPADEVFSTDVPEGYTLTPDDGGG